jgi:hypothetical protein
MKLAFLFMLPLMAGCASSPVTHGIPNFAWVDYPKRIARGGQPTSEGFAWLVSQAVTNDVKLNTGTDAAPGMKVKPFPISTWQQLFGGRKLMLEAAEASYRITPGTFVHCTHGQDRTGLAVALYRREQGWTAAAAQKEMLDHGFHKSLRGLWKAWLKFQPLIHRTQSSADPFTRAAFKRALDVHYAQEEHHQERRALRYQLSMSKTNYPPFK